MSSVEFQEPEFHYRKIDISGAVTHNTPFIIRWGFAKNLTEANIIMMIIFAVFLGVTIYFISRGFSASEIKYKEDFTPEQLQNMLPDITNRLPTKNK